MNPILRLTLVASVFVAAWQIGTLKHVPIINQSYAQIPDPAPSYLRLRDRLRPICACESADSGGRYGIPQQFEPDGSPRYGRVNPSDVGLCQINRYYHLATAIRMGLDIVHSAADNVTFANHLYDTQGVKPWKWSAACHGQTE